MNFGDQIHKGINNIDKDLNKVYRGSALTIFSAIIERTPVLSGRLRGNWFVSLNRKSKSITEFKDKSGAQSIKFAKTQSAKATMVDTIYMTNNLPYVLIIENGDANRAPFGMVKSTIDEWNSIVKGNK